MEAVAVGVGVVITSVICIFYSQTSTWLRSKLNKKVQCWFCHVGSRVKYVDANSWTCPSCGQYNGFDKDGSYNREIPGQYDDKLNLTVTNLGRRRRDFRRDNTLCPQCNYNQELKVKQLAAFVPIYEAKYDQEIEHYRLQLEESYKLCKECEQLVANVVTNQKYILPGPRRLVQLTTRLVFKSCWTLYASMLLSMLMMGNRLLSAVPAESLGLNASTSLRLADPLASQVLAGLGVILHTLQCCQFGTYWSFINWVVWAAVASSPHFLQSQLPQHISYIQMAICGSLLVSSLIILVRRKRHEKGASLKEQLRKERRKREESTATWTSFRRTAPKMDGSPEQKRDSPVKLSPAVEKRGDTKKSQKSERIIKPVARKPEVRKKKEDLDMSSLSIGGRMDNPFCRAAFVQSPWEQEPLTRSSSHSSGISSLRASPVIGNINWGKSGNLRSPDCNWKNQDCGWSKARMTPANFGELPKSDNLFRNDAWSSQYDGYPNTQREWDKKQWPTHLYTYPVAYTWPSPTPWDRSPSVPSNNSSYASSPEADRRLPTATTSSSTIPTFILAITNAILVYYILNLKG